VLRICHNMHTVDLDLHIEELTKVEGAATVDVKVRNGKVEKLTFGITEYKRFYTQAMRGKSITALPQLLARVCGTCSNAHLLCSIEACERALGITPTPQSQILKRLTMYGLNIRDHALHLYLFVSPDLVGKDNFLSFDENIPEEHEMLHDAFDIKAAGNHLAQLVAGRSVHALFPTIGGFIKIPTQETKQPIIDELKKVRPAVLRLIKTFKECDWSFDRKTRYMGMSADHYSFLEGEIISDDGQRITEEDYHNHLEHVVIPYSQASGYMHDNESYMVGSLARMNLSREKLHPQTQKDASDAIALFPSTNIYHNNLAQAIETLHCVDDAIELLEGNTFAKEEIPKPVFKEGTGIGVVEAPRGMLYHRVHIGDDGKVIDGDIVVPTGQNQINIEEDLHTMIQQMLDDGVEDKEKIQSELEKLIRAYDPCMSCASHFLRLNWQEL
jgi:sulfhydrogenase subunit alpha